MDHHIAAERDSTLSFADAETDYGDDGDSPLPGIDHNEVFSSQHMDARFIKCDGCWGVLPLPLQGKASYYSPHSN
jgi:hypothetical protein